MNVGFIGLGRMGAPMLRNIVASGVADTVAVYDGNPDVTVALASELTDVTPCVSPREVGASSDIVVTMLPNGDIVRAVVTGESGVLDGMAQGGTIIDMSSSYPSLTRDLGADLASKGIALVDAPVSGGVRKAIDGTMSILLGCDSPKVADRIAPLLGAMGKVVPAGPLGSGHAAKALNNYVSAAGLVAACEALIIGQRFGLDPSRLTEILNASTGRNNSTENKLAQFVVPERYRDAGFALTLMAKDIRAAAQMADEVEVASPRLEEASQFWTRAEDLLGQGADHTEIHALIAGTYKT